MADLQYRREQGARLHRYHALNENLLTLLSALSSLSSMGTTLTKIIERRKRRKVKLTSKNPRHYSLRAVYDLIKKNQNLSAKWFQVILLLNWESNYHEKITKTKWRGYNYLL